MSSTSVVAPPADDVRSAYTASARARLIEYRTTFEAAQAKREAEQPEEEEEYDPTQPNEEDIFARNSLLMLARVVCGVKEEEELGSAGGDPLLLQLDADSAEEDDIGGDTSFLSSALLTLGRLTAASCDRLEDETAEEAARAEEDRRTAAALRGALVTNIRLNGFQLRASTFPVISALLGSRMVTDLPEVEQKTMFEWFAELVAALLDHPESDGKRDLHARHNLTPIFLSFFALRHTRIVPVLRVLREHGVSPIDAEHTLWQCACSQSVITTTFLYTYFLEGETDLTVHDQTLLAPYKWGCDTAEDIMKRHAEHFSLVSPARLAVDLWRKLTAHAKARRDAPESEDASSTALRAWLQSQLASLPSLFLSAHLIVDLRSRNTVEQAMTDLCQTLRDQPDLIRLEEVLSSTTLLGTIVALPSSLRAPLEEVTTELVSRIVAIPTSAFEKGTRNPLQQLLHSQRDGPCADDDFMTRIVSAVVERAASACAEKGGQSFTLRSLLVSFPHTWLQEPSDYLPSPPPMPLSSVYRIINILTANGFNECPDDEDNKCDFFDQLILSGTVSQVQAWLDLPIPAADRLRPARPTRAADGQTETLLQTAERMAADSRLAGRKETIDQIATLLRANQPSTQ